MKTMRMMMNMVMRMITQSVCPYHSDSKPPPYPDISTHIHSREKRVITKKSTCIYLGKKIFTKYWLTFIWDILFISSFTCRYSKKIRLQFWCIHICICFCIYICFCICICILASKGTLPSLSLINTSPLQPGPTGSVITNPVMLVVLSESRPDLLSRD